MNEGFGRPRDDYAGVKYESEAETPNLMDYRHMDIMMNRWAVTDSGCLSLVALIFIGVCFFVVFSLVQ